MICTINGTLINNEGGKVKNNRPGTNLIASNDGSTFFMRFSDDELDAESVIFTLRLRSVVDQVNRAYALYRDDFEEQEKHSRICFG